VSDLVQLLPLVLLGAVFGLDVVSFPQAMISRPIVAATAASTLLGNPLPGLIVGATLAATPTTTARDTRASETQVPRTHRCIGT
jgi:mannose/fructose/N-acetylgalactosamine-specific phosphotransferase system component IIC